MWVAARAFQLVATLVAWKGGGASESVLQHRFIIQNTLDAQRLAVAVSRPGATVWATWVGNVTLASRIEVGPSSRLSISGHGTTTAQLLPPLPQREGGLESAEIGNGLFILNADSHVRLRNLSISGAHGQGLLLSLKEKSRVTAHNCTFESSVVSNGVIRRAAVSVARGARLELRDGCAFVSKGARSCAVLVDQAGALDAQRTLFRREPAAPTSMSVESEVAEESAGVFIHGARRDSAENYAGMDFGENTRIGWAVTTGVPLVHLVGGTARLTDCNLLDTAGHLFKDTNDPSACRFGEPADCGHKPPILLLEEGSDAMSFRSIFNGRGPRVRPALQSQRDGKLRVGRLGGEETAATVVVSTDSSFWTHAATNSTPSRYQDLRQPKDVVFSTNSSTTHSLGPVINILGERARVSRGDYLVVGGNAMAPFLENGFTGRKQAVAWTLGTRWREPERDERELAGSGGAGDIFQDERGRLGLAGDIYSGGGSTWIGQSVAGDAGNWWKDGRGRDIRNAATLAVHEARLMSLPKCARGYEGQACETCVPGYLRADDGTCERCSTARKIRSTVWTVVVAIAGASVIMLSLDAVRNGKSPPCRVAQIWRRVPRTRRGRFGGTWHDRKSNTIVTIRPKKSTVCGHMTWTVGAGVRGKGSPFWEREALGRFVQGGMVFVATAQIVTQSVRIMELELPDAMAWMLTWLEWTNLDPVVMWAGLSCLTSSVRFFDRVDGTIGLVTAYLALLLASHVCPRSWPHSSSIWCLRRNQKFRDEQRGRTAASSLDPPHGNPTRPLGYFSYPMSFSHSASPTLDLGGFSTAEHVVGRGIGRRIHQRQDVLDHGMSRVRLAPAAGSSSVKAKAPKRSWWWRSRLSLSDMEAGLGANFGYGGQGLWERWDRWKPWERHACALVVVCILVHPAVCTTLLQVFDCADGYALRADELVLCLSAGHQSYKVCYRAWCPRPLRLERARAWIEWRMRIVAGVFLILYGVGLPGVVLAMVLWATERSPPRRLKETNRRRSNMSSMSSNDTISGTSDSRGRQGRTPCRSVCGPDSLMIPGPPSYPTDASSGTAVNASIFSGVTTLCATEEEGETVAFAEMRSRSGGSGRPPPAATRRGTNPAGNTLGGIRDTRNDILDLMGGEFNRFNTAMKASTATAEIATVSAENVTPDLGARAAGAGRFSTTPDRDSAHAVPGSVASSNGCAGDWRAQDGHKRRVPRVHHQLVMDGSARINRNSRDDSEMQPGEPCAGGSLPTHGRRNRSGGSSSINSNKDAESKHRAMSASNLGKDLSSPSSSSSSSSSSSESSRRSTDAGTTRQGTAGGRVVLVQDTAREASHLKSQSSGVWSIANSCYGGKGDDEETKCARCLGKAWEASGRGVLWIGQKMSSSSGDRSGSARLACRNTVRKRTEESKLDGSSQWRCTIPLWVPYRPGRYWFAAWDLARRLLLTGLLTLIPMATGGAKEYLRVAAAFALAGVTLIVAEAARPFRDPWISWIHRAGGVLILLVNFLGLLQKVGLAGMDMALAGVLASFAPIMVLCVCGGWRLSCAERATGCGSECNTDFPSHTSTASKPHSAHEPSESLFRRNPDARRPPRLHIPRKKSYPAEWARAPSSLSRDRLIPKPSSTAIGGATAAGTSGASPGGWLPEADVARLNPSRGREEQGVGMRDSSPGVSRTYVDVVRAATPREKDGTPKPVDKHEPSLFVNPMFSGRSTPNKAGPAAAAAGTVDAERALSGFTMPTTMSQNGRDRVPGTSIMANASTGNTCERSSYSKSPEDRGLVFPLGASGFKSGSAVISGDGVSAGDNINGSRNGSETSSGEGHRNSFSRLFNRGVGERTAPIPVVPSHNFVRTDGGSEASRTSSGTVASTRSSASVNDSHVASSAQTPSRGRVGSSEDSGSSDTRPSRSRLLERVLASTLNSTGAEGGRGNLWTLGNSVQEGKSDSWSFPSTSESSGDRKAVRAARFRHRNHGHRRGQSSGGSSTQLSRTSSYGNISVSSRSSSMVAPPAFPPLGHHGRGSLSSEVQRSEGLGKVPRAQQPRPSVPEIENNSRLSIGNVVDGPTPQGGDQEDQDRQGNQNSHPLKAPTPPAMPSWWLSYNNTGFGERVIWSNSITSMANRPSPSLVTVAAAERAAAAEVEAHAQRLERVFGVDGGEDRRQFIEFVRSGGSGTSSFDSRSDRSPGRGGAGGHSQFERDEDDEDDDEEDEEDNDEADNPGDENDEDLSRSPVRGLAQSLSDCAKSRWIGNSKVFRTATPLSSEELKRQFDFDFEDECEGEEDHPNFLRISARLRTMGARRSGACEQLTVAEEPPVDAE